MLMKFQVTFKTPDAVTDAVKRYAQQNTPEHLSDAEQDEYLANAMDAALTCVLKWVRYAEVVTIEFDTEADTATVVERNG